MGTPGALHALLTPQLNHGITNFLIFEYYASHSGIILTPLFLAIVLGYRINAKSWLNVFLICQVLLIFVVPEAVLIVPKTHDYFAHQEWDVLL